MGAYSDCPNYAVCGNQMRLRNENAALAAAMPAEQADVALAYAAAQSEIERLNEIMDAHPMRSLLRRTERAEAALREIHDQVDGLNGAGAQVDLCVLCKSREYQQLDGIIHTKTCGIAVARAALDKAVKE